MILGQLHARGSRLLINGKGKGKGKGYLAEASFLGGLLGRAVQVAAEFYLKGCLPKLTLFPSSSAASCFLAGH